VKLITMTFHTERTINLGNYENFKISTSYEARLEPGDDEDEVREAVVTRMRRDLQRQYERLQPKRDNQNG